MGNPFTSIMSRIKSSSAAKGIASSGAYRAVYNTPPAYALRYSLNYLPIRDCIREIKKRGRIQDLGGLFDFATSCTNGLIRPMQVKGEITELLALLRERQIGTFMEIGTANGGTLYLFCNVASEDAFALSLDLPGEILGQGYQAYRLPLYRSFAQGGQRISFIRDDSHAAATREKAASLLSGRPLDFLFIDGDHRYEGVRKDFEMYSPFVKKGGLVAFHDISVEGVEGCEVKKYWDEIKASHKHREIIRDEGKGSLGIGVLFM